MLLINVIIYLLKLIPFCSQGQNGVTFIVVDVVTCMWIY